LVVVDDDVDGLEEQTVLDVVLVYGFGGIGTL
jgi:hypothetical protein